MNLIDKGETNNMKKTFEFNTTISTHREINIKEIPDTNFIYFEDTRTINQNGEIDTKKWSGVTSKENIEKVQGQEPINRMVFTPIMKDHTARIVAFPKKQLEDVQKGILKVESLIRNYAYNPETYPLPESEMLALWNPPSGKLTDLQNNFISLPIHFSDNYMLSKMENNTYDLEKLLKHLQEDPNVLNKENLSIIDVPYCPKTIDFQYLLPTDEYQQLMEFLNLANRGEMRNYILTEYIKLDKFLQKENENQKLENEYNEYNEER